MKWKKVITIAHKYVAWQYFYSLINVTFSCPCAHHDGIWERGGTTPHINPAHLHTVPSDNILATIWSVNLPFSPHFINKWNRWLFQSIHLLVSLFVWVTGFQHHLPTQPGTKRDLGTICVCAVSLTLHLLYPWGKMPSTNWTGGWMGQRFGLKPWGSEKSLDPARNLTSITHSSTQSTNYQPHQLHYHSYPIAVSLILNMCVTVVTDCLYSSHLSFRKKWIYE